MTDTVLCETNGPLARLTLNRPDKLNALDYATIARLMTLLDRLETARTIGAVILTGAGRAFSAGGDIPQFAASIAEGTEVALRDFVRAGQALTARIEAYPKPLIVAVNGLAYGGGCEITEAAPLAIAADTARFAKPEVCIGIPPTFGGTQRLARLAGRKRALELLLTGESFGAGRALEMGLITHITPAPALLDTAEALARRILAHSAPAVSAILAAVTRGINLPIAEGLAVEAAAFARVAPMPETRAALDRWITRKS